MSIRIHIVLGLCVVATPAFAQSGQVTLPPIKVTPFVAECTHPALPSQRQVGEWTGLHNFGQIYAARERLMARISRACQRPGIDRIQVAMHPQPAQNAPHFVAVAQQTR